MKLKSLLWILFTLFMFVVGIVAGMLLGTYILIDHITHGLSGSTIIVNVNETKMVDYTLQRFNETILPQIKYKLNQT